MRINSVHHPMLLAASASVFVLAAAPAHAGYLVSTQASSAAADTRGDYNGCNVFYNYGSQVGYGSGISQYQCGASGSSNGVAKVQYTGSGDTTGKLKAAYDDSLTEGPYGTSHGHAAADLAHAQVHLLATSGAFAGASASAGFGDTLHFHVAGANANTITLIPVHFDFDGTLSPIFLQNGASGQLGFSFSFGGGAIYTYGDYGVAVIQPPAYPTFAYGNDVRVGGWQSYTFAHNPCTNALTRFMPFRARARTSPLTSD